MTQDAEGNLEKSVERLDLWRFYKAAVCLKWRFYKAAEVSEDANLLASDIKNVLDAVAETAKLRDENEALKDSIGHSRMDLIHEKSVLEQRVKQLTDSIEWSGTERDSWLGSKDGKIKGEHWEVVELAEERIKALESELASEKEVAQQHLADAVKLQAKNERLRAVIKRFLTRVEYNWDLQFRDALGEEEGK